MRLCVQEQHLPGATLEEKWAAATAWGYDGIELRARGDGAFAARLPDLRRAAARGVVMPTVCPETDHFVGDFDAARREDAVVQLRAQLDVIAELGGTGVTTPASWGMFSTRLPPFVPPRTEAEDTAVLIDTLGRVAAHAAGLGVCVYLEPLNRYEDHMVNRLEQGAALVGAVGSDALRLTADTFHMNIEEADPPGALRAAAPYLGHVQASDSNRLEPGAGHLDFAALLGVLGEIGYAGDVAVESRLSGPADRVLPRAAELLREAW
ncbi:sugar phosphate isomerase/epimerase family protein [Georgenia yuyongxinii]|uniref:Sugar phosphate isomerase/epimerase n=1 Tax=Georgenia yuyongxinii TaxID=2589797 RepID=A0A552WWV2_9MICO|nr:sugar phosphate isomerase/epimerase family protein [Georgenia yuyongxinii]TRW47311.1 sugar phosphate isomerase/epimerase [Georgenia yuyongxinii]